MKRNRNGDLNKQEMHYICAQWQQWDWPNKTFKHVHRRWATTWVWYITLVKWGWHNCNPKWICYGESHNVDQWFHAMTTCMGVDLRWHDTLLTLVFWVLAQFECWTQTIHTHVTSVGVRHYLCRHLGCRLGMPCHLADRGLAILAIPNHIV